MFYFGYAYHTLCAKISHYGFTFRAAELFCCYLEYRSELLILENAKSTPLVERRGSLFSVIIGFVSARDHAGQNLKIFISGVKVHIVEEYKNLGVMFVNTHPFTSDVSTLQKVYIHRRI